MFKLGCLRNNESQEHHYLNVYTVEQSSNYKRIVVGLAQNHIDTIRDLIAVLNGSFYMLYVLHTPRTGNEPGRYQSEVLTYDEISTILNHFKSFFENDSRHDVWLHSPITNTTIVYDRHNLIYLYDFTDERVHIIEKRGLKKELVNIPYPHVHCYNPECDSFESKLINEYKWIRTSLQDEDKQ